LKILNRQSRHPRWRYLFSVSVLIAVAASFSSLPTAALSQKGHAQHDARQHGHAPSNRAPGGHGQQVHGGSIQATFEAEPTGKPLARRLVITLKDAQTGDPIQGAAIDVNVEMPSMPMLHRVPKTKAEATGTPGQYATTVTLEMAGEWAARVAIEKPSRATFIHRFSVDR
jgi:hypothetical protein